MSLLVLALFLPFLAWWGTWFALAVTAKLRRSPQALSADLTQRLDILVPAYNEAQNLPVLLSSLRAQEPDLLNRILVVADHCTDDTASVARSLGCDVLERNDGNHGKPNAMRAGLEFLAKQDDHGDAAVIVDADCVCDPGFLRSFVERMQKRPDQNVLQSTYVLTPNTIDTTQQVQAGLAYGFGLRNVVRASGADALGLPVGLFGSGILLRWPVVEAFSFVDQRNLAKGRQPSGADVAMWLDLIQAGERPGFVETARLWASIPDDLNAMARQRLRWERGQVHTWRRASGTFFTLLGRRDWRGVLALIDWFAPPLAPTCAAFSVLALVAIVGVAFGISVFSLFTAVLAFVALLGYLTVGVSYLDGRAGVVALLTKAPRFVLWKASVYAKRQGRVA